MTKRASTEYQAAGRGGTESARGARGGHGPCPPPRTLAEGEQEEVEAEAGEEGAHGPLPPEERREGEGREAAGPGPGPSPARTYRRRERTPSATSRSGSR